MKSSFDITAKHKRTDRLTPSGLCVQPIEDIVREITLIRSRYMADGEFPRVYEDRRFETEHEMLTCLLELEREYHTTAAVVHRIEHELLIAKLRFDGPNTTLDYSRSRIFPVKYESRQELMRYIELREIALGKIGPKQSMRKQKTGFAFCQCNSV